MRNNCLVCAINPRVRCLTCNAGLCTECRDKELLSPGQRRKRAGGDEYSQCPMCKTWGGWIDPEYNAREKLPSYGIHTCDCGITMVITFAGEQPCLCNKLFKGEYTHARQR